MQEEVFNIYKPLGYTPLEAIERFRELNPEYKDVKMSYAGRLDPLAEGVLIIVAGEKLKEQESYMKLDKEYVAKILLGFSTDTYDLLGMSKAHNLPEINKKELLDIIAGHKGKQNLPFPPFSSYRIKGKPLFWWARNNKLDEVEIPRTNTEIYSIELNNIDTVSKEELKKIAIDKVDLVKGDFRQEDIKSAWVKNLSRTEHKEFPVLELTINCSSGTYIRTLANELGIQLGSGGVLLHLLRTKVEGYSIDDSIRI